MCGFLVEYNPKNNILPKGEFLQLLDLSVNRGPDYQGYSKVNASLQMGFNRLAILDTSAAGNQPYKSYNSRYTLVFNGEIYNHLSLRKKLEFNNYKSHSDTETIATCLEQFGVAQTLPLLNGMFALVIYDHLEQKLHIARDFAGIKPLYYGFNGSTLIVASQYNQITHHPQFKNNPLDTKVLNLYLQQQFVSPPFGLYKNTFQLLPGEWLTLSKDGSVTKNRFWEFPKVAPTEILDLESALKETSEVLNEVVQRQLLADVPLGMFLSGGVDSALISTAVSATNPNLKAFTIGSDSKKHDECDRAQQFANALNLQQNIWKLSGNEVLKHWEEAIKCLHEPLADISIIPTYLVSKLAKKEVTVALSGDGGDELFFGYERFWSIGKNINYQHYPNLVKKGIYALDKLWSNNKNVNSVLLAQYQAQAHQGLHTRFRNKILKEIAPDIYKVGLPENYDNYNYANTKNLSTLYQQMRKAEFYGMMQKTLRKVDLASMQNSLEVRVPFLDKKMIETALKIDPLLSINHQSQKKVLKKLLLKRVPNVAEETSKKGFSVPLTGWMRTDLKELFYDTLLQEKITQFGFQKKEVEKLLQQHQLGQADHKWPIFTLYALLK